MSFKSELEAYRFIMDIETYVLESTQVPFTNKVIVDKDIMYDFLDRLRSRLPQEMKECKRIIEKREQEENIDKKEHEKYNKPTNQQDTKEAEVEAKQLDEVRMIDLTKQIEETKNKCEKMIKDAEERALQIVKEAYDYSDQIVGTLQLRIEEQITEIKDGRSQIADVTRKIKKA